jgi:hypothetical protein
MLRPPPPLARIPRGAVGVATVHDILRTGARFSRTGTVFARCRGLNDEDVGASWHRSDRPDGAGNSEEEERMKIFKLAAVAGLAVSLAACPDDTRDTDTAMWNDTVADPMATERPMDAAPVAAQRANLDAVAGSGVTGEIHVTPRNGNTVIMLMLQNAPPNESIGSRVHSGTCESPGPELARLDAVSTNDMGMGQSETSVGHAPHLIMDGNHIVAVHRPGADPERDMPIACATIPSHGAAGTGTGY